MQLRWDGGQTEIGLSTMDMARKSDNAWNGRREKNARASKDEGLDRM